MKPKTKKIIFIVVVFFVFPVCILFFEGLWVKQSLILTGGLCALLGYYLIRLWWAGVKIKNPKAIHERGQFNISGTEPFVKHPEKTDKDGNVIYPEFWTFLNEGVHIPSKYISMPGGGEDGWTTVPKDNIIKVGRQLNLGTIDIDVYLTAEDKDRIPPHITQDIQKKCIQMGYIYSPEFPHFFGWAPGRDKPMGNLDVYTIQKALYEDLLVQRAKDKELIEYWRSQAISRQQHEKTPDTPRHQQQQQQDQGQGNYGQQ